MSEIAKALARAGRSLLHPKMLWLMVWPVLVALLVWTILAAMFWGDTWGWIEGHLASSQTFAQLIVKQPWATIATVLSWVLLIVLYVPLVLITATLIIGVAAMPAMVKHVGERDYPQVEARRGGTFLGSMWNSVLAVILLVLLAIVTLPAWVLPPLWPIIPMVLFGYFNQRVFRYDALADHASAAELRTIIRENRVPLFVLGLVVALLGYIPLAGFFVPVIGGLAFIHYCLGKLAAKRRIAPSGR